MTQLAARPKVSSALMRATVLDLRRQGYTVREIADSVGRSIGGTHKILMKALTELQARNLETTADVVALELDRLDGIVRTHWESREDPESAMVILRAMERRARYLGADMPSKTALTDPDGKKLPPPVINIGFSNGGPGASDPATDASPGAESP